MRILIIKTSSMGDIIHTLPALTDAGKINPSIQFDWIVEENFAEIPRWHSLVDQVFPVALRRWRKNIFSKNTRQEWNYFREQLVDRKYDFIIDAQGLLKSAWLIFMAKGLRCGLSWQCSREPLASLLYQKKYSAGKIENVHAVTRMRELFRLVLGYKLPTEAIEYGIDKKNFLTTQQNPYVVFIHGTTWSTKHWPEEHWHELANIVTEKNIGVKLPWGNQSEYERAQRVAANNPLIEVLPRMKLADIASVLAGAKANVAVDTGLGHLSAALDVPTVSLYGPTQPNLVGALGRSQMHLSAPSHDLSQLMADEVGTQLVKLLF